MSEIEGADPVKALVDRAYEQGYSAGESSALADVMALVDGDYDDDDAEALRLVKQMVGVDSAPQ